MITMTKLDEIALNIELVLISIIEAVALTFLGENAIRVMHDPQCLQYLPYVLAGLTILLVFWSQAILHAISFIRWPLRMEHMLLYFLAVFLQIIAYSEITDLVQWFFWWTIFSVLAFIIYVVDLRIIRQMGSSEFMHNVMERHIFEMIYLVPVALAVNVVCTFLVFFLPSFFENPFAYASLGALQFLISIGALIDCVRNFRLRSVLLAKHFH
jgi:hypothetical protein